MTLAQLKEAEDEFDEEDIKAIEIYRYSTAVLGRGGGSLCENMADRLTKNLLYAITCFSLAASTILPFDRLPQLC
jgi:hypothetical protein